MVIDIESQGMDIEEWGASLHIDRGFPIGIGVKDDEENIGFYYAPFSGELIKKIQDSDSLVVHNAKFDIRMLGKNKNFLYNKNIIDTALLAYLYDETTSHRLKKLAKSILKCDVEFNSYKDVPPQDLEKYCLKDIDYTDKLFKFFINNLHSSLWELYYKIDEPFLKILIGCEDRGILVDQEKYLKMKVDLLKKREEITCSIKNLIGDINLNSPKQLVDVLYTQLNMKLKKTKKKNFSVSEDSLESIKDEHPVIGLILEYRKQEKLLNTFISPLSTYIQSDGRVRANFHQTSVEGHGTVTARLSCSRPNLQNQPKFVRELFVPEKGKIFWDVDLSQIEVRIPAHYSEDQELVKAIKEGKDIHTWIASRIYNKEEKDILESERDISKMVVFLILYGGQEFTLAKRTGLSVEDSVYLIQSFFNSFPMLEELIQKVRQTAKERGYVKNLFKRRRHFPPEVWEKDSSKTDRQAFNSLIQSSAGDLLKYLCITFFKKTKNSCLVNTVHDELLLEIEEDCVEEYSCLWKETLKEVEEELNFKVPLESKIKIGKDWKNLKVLDKK